MYHIPYIGGGGGDDHVADVGGAAKKMISVSPEAEFGVGKWESRWGTIKFLEDLFHFISTFISTFIPTFNSTFFYTMRELKNVENLTLGKKGFMGLKRLLNSILEDSASKL